MMQVPYKIVGKKNLAPNVKLFEVDCPLIARKHRPGQFVILRVNEKGERIPLTILETDQAKGIIRIVFQEVGKTTRQLGLLEVGDEILDVIGPLGNPSEIKHFGNVVVIAGGVGVAPAYPEAKALREAGNKIISILGARTKNLLILKDEIRKVSDELYITTDDGSEGHHGLVTDMLLKLIEQGKKIDYVMAIGPAIMMKAVAGVTKQRGIRTSVSLNSIMVDGTGMCGACRVTVGGETKFTCVDGPSFDGHLVDYDELMARLRMYLTEERQALQLWEGECKSGCRKQVP